MPPPVLPLGPPLPIVPPPLFGLLVEVLELEHPTSDAIASALRQTTKTNISVYRRMTSPFADEFLPAGGGIEPS